MTAKDIESHPVVSSAKWLEARKALLQKEKEFTQARDALSRERQALPWEKVEKNYVFEGPHGKQTLAELFDRRSQLLIYHFMLGPGWEEGCKSCSYLADHFDGTLIHLAHRDVTFLVVSRAPFPEIQKFKQRMGWKFPWVSSNGTDFNFDYHVSFKEEDVKKGSVYYNYKVDKFGSEEGPGLSVFYKKRNGEVFHTYSAYERGLDIIVGTYNLLDHVPKGRDEADLAFSMSWVRHHDRYDDDKVKKDELYQPPTGSLLAKRAAG